MGVRAPLRLGVSRCLLGEAVRYDGATKGNLRTRWPKAERVEWIGVCPEVELGMGVPREPVQLEGEAGAPRMLGVESRIDHTCAMHRWAKDRLAELGVEDLDGFVLKSRSPSCGLLDTELVRDGEVKGPIDGLFTASLRAAFPFLPLTSEAQLENPDALPRFLRRARLYRSYKELIAGGAEPDRLRAHHKDVLAALQVHEVRDRAGLARELGRACELACRLQGPSKAKELTRYGQLLHDLLDPL